jgi:hypothetical protein
MHSLGDMAKALNRSTVYLAGLKGSFELPSLAGAAYSAAYLAFLRTIIALRALNISTDTRCVTASRRTYPRYSPTSAPPSNRLPPCFHSHSKF